jgi:hypothetical protein
MTADKANRARPAILDQREAIYGGARELESALWATIMLAVAKRGTRPADELGEDLPHAAEVIRKVCRRLLTSNPACAADCLADLEGAAVLWREADQRKARP